MGQSTGKKLVPDWTRNVGEEVLDIRVARVSRQLPSHQADIIVLTERALFFLKDSGRIATQRRLDFFPSCLAPYPFNAETRIDNLLVGTHNASIMVYSDTHLLWAAKTAAVPVGLGVGTFGNVQGMTVVLTDKAELSVNYLGTDPANQPVQLLDSKELDYEAMDEEHKQLQQLIKNSISAGKAEPTELVTIQVNIPQAIDEASGSFGGRGGRNVTVKVYVSYNGADILENAALIVDCAAPFTVDQSYVPLPALHGTQSSGTAEPVVIPLVFSSPELPRPLKDGVQSVLPSKLNGSLVVGYQTANGDLLAARHKFHLPLCLAGVVVTAQRNVQYKVTLDTNRSPPPLTSLFEDVCIGTDGASANILSFQYAGSGGVDATILVSKNANRFRIQSARFDGLWLLTSQLVHRLEAWFSPAKEVERGETSKEKFLVTCTENLPFSEYFAAIENHFLARQNVAQVTEGLAERAHQFRSIQKRLLVRFKDRNPAPLSNLDVLFEETYKDLMDYADEVETQNQVLISASTALSCSTSLLTLLVALRYELTKTDLRILREHLPIDVSDNPTQGWEEVADAGMTHLLRTNLAKNAKEKSSVPIPLAVPSDVAKLKKHIALVCERIAKGGSLSSDVGMTIATSRKKKMDPDRQDAAAAAAAASTESPAPPTPES
eukprot:NODE_329_length_2224_cov_23.051494_g260_i0.p1 GENE.NODE_329_length_2224_cov_23.051494_g260_i0~~NODE_329_length_2224_cov_23.051494_g260_i0.p1  ORF type:complete len:663 (-),score=183.01 NODE_329_length_2224_cov_23.051494_g260_i0:73-2061(-)